MRGEEGPERLLLEPQQLALVELLAGTGGWLGAANAAAPRSASGPPSPRSKIEPWPRRASSWAFWPADCACASTSSMPRRVAAGRVERAALDQALDRALVDRAGVDPLAEVPDRLELAVRLARRDDRLDRRVADVLDRVEAEADRVAGDDEAVIGGVDVGRQDLDPHLVAAVDEERDLVLGRHHRRDHRRHVLGRVVGLQVGGAVGDQRVAGGVGLVERVVGGRRHQRPQVLGDRRAPCPRTAQPSMNLPSIVAIRSRFFLPTALRRSSASAGVKPPSCFEISISCSW